MDGSNNNQPSDGVPMPKHEALNPIGVDQIPIQSTKPEMSDYQTEKSGTPTMPQATTIGPSPIALPSTNQSASTTIPIPVNDAPPMADDTDLIEKEWVSKAKYIVEATRNDPHLLNKEMNKFKADYIQKRYNKQLKVDED